MRSFYILLAILGVAVGCGSSDRAEKPGAKQAEKGKKKSSASEEDLKARLQELERLEQAAVLAVAEKDFARGRRCAEQGLEQTPDGKGPEIDLQRARFLLVRGDADREDDNETAARQSYTDAMAIFHVRKNDRGRFSTFLAMGQLEMRRGDHAAAEQQYAQAEELLSSLKDRALEEGQLKLQRGRLASRQVKHDAAYALIGEAVKIFDQKGNKRARAEALVLLAAEEDALERANAARVSLERALKLYRELGDKSKEAEILHRMATMARRDGQLGTAKQLFTKALEIYQKLDRSSAALAVRRQIDAMPETSEEVKN